MTVCAHLHLTPHESLPMKEHAFDAFGRRTSAGFLSATSRQTLTFEEVQHPVVVVFLILLFGCAALTGPAEAQDKRTADTFYLGAGAGISDYAGDNDGEPETDNVTGASDFLFDTEKFTKGGVFPYTLTGETGYRLSKAFDIGLSYRFGQFPFVHGRPFTTREGPPGKGGNLGTVRHTIEALSRYTFKADDWTVAPYFSGGVNVTLGGHEPGIGPSIGVGLDARLNDQTSLFLELRSSTAFNDDAVDGIETGTPVDVLSETPALGIRRDLRSPNPPRLLGLNCASSVQADEPAAFMARINAEEAVRPVTVQWSFGDGRTATGQTVSHTYGRPGTYDVRVTAQNDAGTAQESCSVTVNPVPEPAVVAGVDATPNPAQECDAVRFEAEAEGDRPIEYQWRLGDGTSASGASTTHTYSGPGAYTARLTVSNEYSTGRDSVTVRVERPKICTTVQEFNSVLFTRGSSGLTRKARRKLRDNARVLLKCPNLQARIEGTAVPEEPAPETLSEARAEAVATFYRRQGLSPKSLEAVGTGTEDGQAGKKGPERRLRKAETAPIQIEAGCPQRR